MKKYHIRADERWPTMYLTEDYDYGDGYYIPDQLIERFNKASKELDDAEKAILKHCGLKEF